VKLVEYKNSFAKHITKLAMSPPEDPFVLRREYLVLSLCLDAMGENKS